LSIIDLLSHRLHPFAASALHDLSFSAIFFACLSVCLPTPPHSLFFSDAAPFALIVVRAPRVWRRACVCAAARARRYAQDGCLRSGLYAAMRSKALRYVVFADIARAADVSDDSTGSHHFGFRLRCITLRPSIFSLTPIAGYFQPRPLPAFRLILIFIALILYIFITFRYAFH